MKKTIYYLEHYIRCGEMPLYMIFYRNQAGRRSHCIMLCTMKNLKALLRKRRGFSDPKQYGHVVYNGQEEKPTQEVVAMLRSRYHFDLLRSSENTVDAF